MAATTQHIADLARVAYIAHATGVDRDAFVRGFACGYICCEIESGSCVPVKAASAVAMPGIDRPGMVPFTLQPGGGHSQNTQRTLDTTPPGFQSSAVESETHNKCFGAFRSAGTSGPVQCEGGAAVFQKESNHV